LCLLRGGAEYFGGSLEARFDKGEGDTGCIFRATIQTSREARERLTFGEGEGRGETGERYLAPEAVKAEA